MVYIMRNLLFTVFTLLYLIIPDTCLAVNFYDGARAPKGLYALSYTTFYAADKTTDAKGKRVKDNYGYKKVEELLRLCYYSPDLALTILVPAGYMRVGYYDSDSYGLGDVNIGGGYFLPIKKADILPMLFIKFPTGEYDSSKTVNYGTHQYDIKPMVFLYKQFDKFSVDAAVKYFFRLENESNHTAPGDEWHLQCLLGYNVTKNLKLGPSVSWMTSGHQRLNDIIRDDTAKESFSLGGDIYYRLPAVSLSVTYLHDLRTENSTKGHFFQFKACHKF